MEIGLVTPPRLEANLMILAISPTLDTRNLDREPSVHFCHFRALAQDGFADVSVSISTFDNVQSPDDSSTTGTVSAFWHLALAPPVPKVLPHSRRADFLESRRLAHAAVGSCQVKSSAEDSAATNHQWAWAYITS
ncbi:hypothetical protein Landi51_01689 [Colletotrichum acutatum]